MSDESSYPAHFVGEPAGPPEQVHRRVLDMALRAHARAAGEPVETVAPWRSAYSLDVMFGEANAADPHRNKASDGTIGDAAHQAEGKASDHNPWVIYKGEGIVRAGDVTNDPAMNLPAVAERIRLAALAGRLPQVTGGGYVILLGRITNANWTGWHEYTGPDPHVSHMHVSVSLSEDHYDARAAWGVFTDAPAPAPTPPPAPKPAPQWTGPDATGSGPSFRAQFQPAPQSNGARVQQLQAFLNARYPLYSKLATDGWYGAETAKVVAEFARRSDVAGADGNNIGPRIALALYKAGWR